MVSRLWSECLGSVEMMKSRIHVPQRSSNFDTRVLVARAIRVLFRDHPLWVEGGISIFDSIPKNPDMMF